MATLADVEQHRSAVDDVITLAIAELATEWDALPDTPTALVGPLADLMAELYGDFSQMTATLAADWYDDLRIVADAPGRFTAALAPEISGGQIRSSASWASSAAWVDLDKALRDSAASLERMLADRDRSTVDVNVGADPAAPRYGRHASANACAFCALNATRGPVFRSEDAAGKKYHDHCACIAVPSWTHADYTEAPYVSDWRQAYFDAADDLGRGAGTKALLAHMRTNAGLR